MSRSWALSVSPGGARLFVNVSTQPSPPPGPQRGLPRAQQQPRQCLVSSGWYVIFYKFLAEGQFSCFSFFPSSLCHYKSCEKPNLTEYLGKTL